MGSSIVAALAAACLPLSSLSGSHLKYMSLYGWEQQLTAGMVGWVNLPKGPVDITSATNPKPSLPEIVAATLSAYKQLPSPILWGLPSGIISPGATSLPAGWDDKLVELHSHVSPLVRSRVVAGFFLGDEQCANGTCIENQLGPVAARLHQLFDPSIADTPTTGAAVGGQAKKVLVYANEALKICDPKRGNTSWLLPSSIDLFSVDVYSSGGLAQVAAVKAAVAECILPRLSSPSQSIMLVPGIFGNSGLPIGQGRCTGRNKYGAPAYAQNETVLALKGLFAFAKTQPRIAGFCPCVPRMPCPLILYDSTAVCLLYHMARIGGRSAVC